MRTEPFMYFIFYTPNMQFLFSPEISNPLSKIKIGVGECQEYTFKCLYRSTSRSGVFIVNFENISLLFLVSIVDFEQVSAEKFLYQSKLFSVMIKCAIFRFFIEKNKNVCELCSGIKQLSTYR